MQPQCFYTSLTSKGLPLQPVKLPSRALLGGLFAANSNTARRPVSLQMLEEVNMKVWWKLSVHVLLRIKEPTCSCGSGGSCMSSKTGYDPLTYTCLTQSTTMCITACRQCNHHLKGWIWVWISQMVEWARVNGSITQSNVRVRACQEKEGPVNW